MLNKSEQWFRKYYLILLAIFSAFFLNSWNMQAVEGASGERNPFALPAEVQKSGAGQKPGETGAIKPGQEPFQGFRVTTILISGQTRVAAVNGVLKKKGDEIDGYRLAEIEEKQVTLVKGKEKLVLKIDSRAGYSFNHLNSSNQF
jgi:hypothetical protein